VQLSSFVAVAGAPLLIASAWRGGAVSWHVAIVCAVLSVLIPPWIFPGAGVVF
jgi:ABC-type transport system involved in multi-copper enzyme maturation permease subunit